jgi:hypothetical protein
VAVDHDFHDIRIGQLRGVRDSRAERRHQQLGVVSKRRDRLLDHRRLHQWLVALHVDDDVALDSGGHFGKTIRARGVRGARHHRLTAEALYRAGDAVVVGRHQHTGDAAGARRALVDVLDHRASRDERQGFAGETCRLVSGGNDDDASELCGMLGGRNREHVES